MAIPPTGRQHVCISLFLPAIWTCLTHRFKSAIVRTLSNPSLEGWKMQGVPSHNDSNVCAFTATVVLCHRRSSAISSAKAHDICATDGNMVIVSTTIPSHSSWARHESIFRRPLPILETRFQQAPRRRCYRTSHKFGYRVLRIMQPWPKLGGVRGKAVLASSRCLFLQRRVRLLPDSDPGSTSILLCNIMTAWGCLSFRVSPRWKKGRLDVRGPRPAVATKKYAHVGSMGRSC